MGHFSSTRLFALWFITVGFISITSCVTSISVNTNVNVNPGRVYGNIIFENTSVEIAAHLASNNVVDHPLTDTGLEPVRLTNPSTRDLQASSYYTSVNTAPDASTYIAASYDMNPNVEDTGSDFLAWVQNIKFSDGASYVMGSPNNLSTYANMCTGVMPITTNPSGTQCHISECAGLIKVKFS